MSSRSLGAAGLLVDFVRDILQIEDPLILIVLSPRWALVQMHGRIFNIINLRRFIAFNRQRLDGFFDAHFTLYSSRLPNLIPADQSVMGVGRLEDTDKIYSGRPTAV